MVKPSPLLPVRAWLDELGAQVAALRATAEPESVHRMRVAAGRLSVWLELGARRALRDDLRRLRRSASVVRDLDVIAANAADDAWIEILRSERAQEAARLRVTISSGRVDALLDALACVPEPDAVCVRSALQRMKRRVLRAGDRLDDPEGRERALHRLRRRVRRLRYALDWMGADAADLRDLQQHLGGLNDLAVEMERLESRTGDLALDARRKSVRRGMEEHRGRAVEAWRALRPRVGEL